MTSKKAHFRSKKGGLRKKAGASCAGQENEKQAKAQSNFCQVKKRIPDLFHPLTEGCLRLFLFRQAWR